MTFYSEYLKDFYASRVKKYKQHSYTDGKLILHVAGCFFVMTVFDSILISSRRHFDNASSQCIVGPARQAS